MGYLAILKFVGGLLFKSKSGVMYALMRWSLCFDVIILNLDGPRLFLFTMVCYHSL